MLGTTRARVSASLFLYVGNRYNNNSIYKNVKEMDETSRCVGLYAL